jgi:hypothetical protein
MKEFIAIASVAGMRLTISRKANTNNKIRAMRFKKF